ncbi:hypothetical protein BRAS3843_190015 [Bradyrhizobium sp. STM 3843]|nr:hypothetical protein BRAS3843_190015 [Bradyrhizobium sp. STM 3843]
MFQADTEFPARSLVLRAGLESHPNVRRGLEVTNQELRRCTALEALSSLNHTRVQYRSASRVIPTT